MFPATTPRTMSVDKDYVDGWKNENSYRHVNFVSRLLAGGDDVELDYTILSVAVMTLGLLLIVDLGRHRMDHAALNRPFFSSVLEHVYGERK